MLSCQGRFECLEIGGCQLLLSCFLAMLGVLRHMNRPHEEVSGLQGRQWPFLADPKNLHSCVTVITSVTQPTYAMHNMMAFFAIQCNGPASQSAPTWNRTLGFTPLPMLKGGAWYRPAPGALDLISL